MTGSPGVTPSGSTAPELPTRRLGVLLIKGLGSSLDYFKTVDQALASKKSLGSAPFRLEGMVKAGTVARTSSGAAFDVEQGDRSIHVINRGSPPQLFKAGMPVIVVGHFASAKASVFESNEIMVKHSSSYIVENPNRVKASDGSVN